MQFPTLRLLTALSERGAVDSNLSEAAREDAGYFIEQAKLRYVVVDTRLSSPELRQTAIRLLGLRLLRSDGAIELYRVP